MKNHTKKILDYLSYSILIISAVYLLYTRINGDILLQVRHIAGLVLLALPFVAFFYSHKLGVLATGLLLLLGLFGVISYSPAISTMTVGKTLEGDEGITLLYFQPIFLLWLLLHFILSGRYYVGVLSEKYWKNIKSDEPFKIGVDTL